MNNTSDAISPVLDKFIFGLGLRTRGLLAPYQERARGTFGDGKDPQRIILIADWAVRDLLPTLLEYCGFEGEALSLSDLPEITGFDETLLRALNPLMKAALAIEPQYGVNNQQLNYTVNSTLEAIGFVRDGRFDQGALAFGFVSRRAMSSAMNFGHPQEFIQENSLRALDRLFKL